MLCEALLRKLRQSQLTEDKFNDAAHGTIFQVSTEYPRAHGLFLNNDKQFSLM